MRSALIAAVLLLESASVFAADNEPPASSEVAAAIQPYLDQHKMAGVIGIVADKTGKVHRFPEAGGGLFSTTHDIFRYGLMLANDGELDGKRYLSHEAVQQLRTEQTGSTKVNYSPGYHLRHGMFGHDGALGTDLSVHPETGMIAIFMVQCTSGDQWAARDAFLKTDAGVPEVTERRLDWSRPRASYSNGPTS